MSYPVLADRFFEELRPTHEFFSRWKEQGQWGPQLLPLYEWEGLLFVATSEDLPVAAQPSWCVIKASPDQLQSLWAEFSGEGSLQFEESTQVPDLTALTRTSATTAATSEPPPPPPPEFGEETPNPTTISKPAALKTEKPKVAPASPTTTPEQEAEWQELWKQLSAVYQSTMIMLVQNRIALPWKWNPSLKGNSKPVLMELASPFRVAFRTLKSFHGPIAPNEISTEFFSEWNNGEIPAQLTISPVLQDDNLIAFIVGWGNSSSNSKEALMTMESAAKKIAQIFNSHPDTLRVA